MGADSLGDMNFATRLQWALEQAQAKPTDLAKSLGGPGPNDSRVANWLKGPSKPNGPGMAAITAFFNSRGLPIRQQWLLHGTGSPLEPRITTHARVLVSQLSESSRSLPILGCDTVKLIPEHRRLHGAIRLEGLGSVEGWKDVYGLDASAGAFVVRAEGDAMEDEPREGDLLYVDPERQPRRGNIVVAVRAGDGASLVRKLTEEGSARYLVAKNTRYPIIPFDQVEIVGVVLRMERELV